MPLQQLQGVKEHILRYHLIFVHICQLPPPEDKLLLISRVLGIPKAFTCLSVLHGGLEILQPWDMPVSPVPYNA